MFLVLIEYTETEGREWSVCAHGPKGLRSTFNTREMAENYAMGLAENRTNRFAVVQVKSWYQQETRKVKVEKIHLFSGGGEAI